LANSVAYRSPSGLSKHDPNFNNARDRLISRHVSSVCSKSKRFYDRFVNCG